MYLFIRRRRPEPSKLAAATNWYVEVIHQVREATGKDVSGWSTVMSPDTGTCMGAVWVEHLEEVEQLFDKLRVSHEYTNLIERSAGLFVGPLEDSIIEVVHGNRLRTKPEYTLIHRAVPANGMMREAVAVAIDAAKLHETITGVPVVFGTSMTGAFGECNWFASFGSINDVEKAGVALNSDPRWADLIDRLGLLFTADSGIGTLTRRIT
jgi:hypothetical protein